MRKGQNTKEKLLKALEDEIFEKGYENTTLTSIAQRAEVAPSLISYHFKNIQTAANMLFASYQNKAIEPVKYLRKKDPLLFLFAADLLSTFACHENPVFRDINLHTHKDGMLSRYSKFESSRLYWDTTYSDIIKKYKGEINADLFRILRIRDSAGRREFSILADTNEEITTDRELWKKIVYTGHTPILLLAGIKKQTIDKCFEEACKLVDKIIKNEISEFICNPTTDTTNE